MNRTLPFLVVAVLLVAVTGLAQDNIVDTTKVAPALDSLGGNILVDYMRNRRRRVR